MNAIKLGKYRGKTYYRFTVEVRQSSLLYTLIGTKVSVQIIAANAAEACNTIRDDMARQLRQPTAFVTAGPLGGRTERFVGWESLVGERLWYGFYYRQLELSLLMP